MDQVASLEVTSVVAVTSASAAMVSATAWAVQIILTPENVWIPAGIVFGLVGIAIWTTIRAVRIFDRLTGDVNKIKKHLKLED